MKVIYWLLKHFFRGIALILVGIMLPFARLGDGFDWLYERKKHPEIYDVQ